MSRHASAETLSAYLDQEIDAAEAERLERHLGDCAECRRRLEGLRRVVGKLGSLERSMPPQTLGLEIQGHLLRGAPALEERPSSGRRLPRLLFQPIILASLGVVIALAVVVLLFLQALEQSPGAGRDREVNGVTEEVTLVVVDGRSFRRGATGWVEVGLDRADLDATIGLERREVVRDADLDAQIGAVLDALDGEVTLRLADGRVARISP